MLVVRELGAAVCDTAAYAETSSMKQKIADAPQAATLNCLRMVMVMYGVSVAVTFVLNNDFDSCARQ